MLCKKPKGLEITSKALYEFTDACKLLENVTISVVKDGESNNAMVEESYSRLNDCRIAVEALRNKQSGQVLEQKERESIRRSLEVIRTRLHRPTKKTSSI